MVYEGAPMFPRRMMRTSLILLIVASGLLLGRPGFVNGQEVKPVFRLEAAGPTSYITGLAFSPDGKSLYVGGFDKVVRVWTLDESTGQFELDDRTAFRVPIGPGQSGAINAISVSADGQWLAVAGRGAVVGEAGFRDEGRVVPAAAISRSMRLDLGTIYVFNTRDQQVKTLRGHFGEVVAMTFVPGRAELPTLVSAAAETVDGRDRSKLIAWDLASGKQVAAHELPWQASGHASIMRPRLTGWRHQGVSYAGLAWGAKVRDGRAEPGGYFAVWPFESGSAPLPAAERFEAANTIAYYGPDGANDLLLGTDDYAQGGQYFWRLTWFEVPAQTGQPSNAFEHKFGPTSAPRRARELALLSRDREQPLAVVVLGDVKQGRYARHVLQCIDLKARRPLSTIDLGTPADPRRAPVLASVVGGQHVAVAGFGDQVIRVYQVKDLRTGRARSQLLRSAGTRFPDIRFARHSENAELGLVFGNQTAGNAVPRQLTLPSTAQVFNLKAGRFEPPQLRSSWRATSAAAEPLSWSARDGQLKIKEKGREIASINPPPSDQTITVAISNRAAPPLVALSTHRDGQPLIWLYEARTGQLLRRLTAHTLPVQSLAFSDDGSLLASAGEDQFACVWNLTDLDDVIGKHSTLAGVALAATKGRVVVREIEDTSLPLRVDDILLGQVEEGQVNAAWNEPWDVYNSFWKVPPGDPITASVARQGRQPINLQLPTKQGVDERKPLFSLFVFRDPEPNQATVSTRWIGWSPNGYYDASDEDAETALGWHFNRQGQTPPTSFARADRYRQEYRYPGLLDYLIDNREPPLMAFRPALPRPEMDFVFPAAEKLSFAEPMISRTPYEQLRLYVRNYPDPEIEAIELHIDGVKLTDFRREPDQAWLAEIPRQAWTRGRHEFQAILSGRDRNYSDQLAVRYIPPPPQVLVASAIEAETNVAEIMIPVTVKSGLENEPVIYRTVHLHGSQTDRSEPREIELTSGDFTDVLNLQLSPGLNQIEIFATNANAIDGQREAESEHRTIKTIYNAPVPIPLSVAIRDVSLERTSGEVTTLPFTAGTPIVVEKPRAQIRLDVTSGQQVKLSRQIDQAETLALTLEPLSAEGTLTTTDEVELNPGVRQLTYLAEDADGQTWRGSLEIDFRPPLPEIGELIAPVDRATFVAGENVPVDFDQVTVRIQLEKFDSDFQPHAELILNGTLVDVQPSISEAGLMSVNVPATTGVNDVRIRLTNPWRPGQQVAADLSFELFRPPIITPIVPPPVDKEPFVDLVFDIESWAKPSLVTVNGNPIPRDQIKQGQSAKLWRIDTRVGLVAGTNELLVKAWNLDGQSLRPGKLTLDYKPPPSLEPAPTISLEPTGDFQTTESTLAIQFGVTSTTPLTNVQLFHNQRLITTYHQAEPKMGARYFVNDTVAADLVTGMNLISVRAANAGGEVGAAINISRVEPPVRIVLDKLVSKVPEHPSQALTPVSQRGNSMRFEQPAAHWLPSLEGYVEWSHDNPHLRVENLSVQVWVNGFQQIPRDVEMSDGAERRRNFRVPVLLNQERDNHIQIKLPGVKDEEASRLDFYVDCEQPQTDQRLHVVLVGVGVTEQEEDQIVQRFVDAIQVNPGSRSGDVFQSGAFRFGRIHTVPGGVARNGGHVISALRWIGQEIRRLNQDSPQNDVVMLYYQGGEVVEESGDFYLTMTPTPSQPLDAAMLRRKHLGGSQLASVISHLQGAQLLLLDVARTRNAHFISNAKLPGFDRAAVLRCAWLNLPKAIESQLLVAMTSATADDEVRLGTLRDDVLAKVNQVSADKLRFEHYVPETLQQLLVIRSPSP